MTETNGFSQGQDVSSSAPMTEAVSNTPVNEAPQERIFKQQEVNEIVGREKREAVERFKRSLETNQSNQPQNQPQSRPVHQDHLEHISEERFRRMAAEEITRAKDQWVQDAQRTAQEQEAQRIAQDFLTKIDAGKTKYQDFDQVLGDFEFGAIPHVVHMATMMDNTADIMYELAKNPSKIASLQQLQSISPKLAYSEMQRIAKSLKDNEQAANTKMPNEPLGQLRPSNTGTDNGVMTVSDYRKKYRA